VLSPTEVRHATVNKMGELPLFWIAGRQFRKPAMPARERVPRGSVSMTPSTSILSRNSLGGFVRNPRCFPSLDLFLRWLEIPLHPASSDREHLDESEVFRVLRQNRRERAWDNIPKEI
jgi:hypothetical protein